MKRLFGTDGIRAKAGEFPLDKKTVQKLGFSLARQFREKLGREPRFVTARDTRESGEWIEVALQTGAAGNNAVCESAGVITTPGVAHLTNAYNFDAGIVVSASHNPFEDNGIKIFLPSGKKIDEDLERAIEKDISDEMSVEVEIRELRFSRSVEFGDSYLKHLQKQSDGLSLTGKRIVVDCANGAASEIAPKLFTSVGAETIVINNSPDGKNINDTCGSLHLKNLQTKVLAESADVGVAFDGDADRALFVNEKGEIVDGDATLWVMAQYLKENGQLANSMVVATVMSNIGLELALKSKGINLLRTDVGDKYVLEKLIETGSEIGGEQSGHIIFPTIKLVGDGMMTALLLLKAITERGISMSEAVSGFVRYPQILVNVKVKEKRPFDDLAGVAAAARQIETELQGEGRLLLRYSGTENLARVMIEGEDQVQIEAQANRLADIIRTSLG
jgi:phosphoglucosamine mutase